AGSPAGSFVVKGDRPGRDRVGLGLGLTARVTEDVQLYFDYDASISSSLFAHAVTAGITYTW
ncbi:MAG: autotransporter domain-containing protein, partial [Deltaproteobacteria bacterium]|nr:autotransporter domain-containing protein [Deltaproteobacteria bacterium]